MISFKMLDRSVKSQGASILNNETVHSAIKKPEWKPHSGKRAPSYEIWEPGKAGTKPEFPSKVKLLLTLSEGDSLEEQTTVLCIRGENM